MNKQNTFTHNTNSAPVSRIRLFRYHGTYPPSLVKNVLGILSIVISIISVPVMTLYFRLTGAPLNIYCVLDTVLLFAGLVILWDGESDRLHQKVSCFALDQMGQLYLLDIDRRFYQDSGSWMDATRITKLFYMARRAGAAQKLENAQSSLIRRSDLPELLENILEGVCSPPPPLHIASMLQPDSRKCIGGHVIISYRNGETGRKEQTLLFPSNEGYEFLLDHICLMQEGRI